MRTTTWGCLMCLVVGAGCQLVGGDDDGGVGAGGGDAGGGAGANEAGSGGEAGRGGPPIEGLAGDPPNLPPGWNTSSHPCAGNRTDAVLFEGDTAFVGCGTTTSGFGLFRSDDGGMSWSAPASTGAQDLAAIRVNSIQRGSDSLLYLGGTDASGNSAWSVDTSAEPHVVDNVLIPGNTVDELFPVGTFRRAPDGRAIAESLTGYGMLYRPSDDTGPNGLSDGWVSGYYWADGGAVSHQILDLEVHAGGFYGCGATIAEPPMVYLPSKSPSQPYFMDKVVLGSYAGEMWSLAVADDGRIVVGGVDQNADRGMIYVSGDDPYDATQWTEFSVANVVPGQPTWIRGVCTNGERIVAAGELSMTSGPLLLLSDDGGQSFEVVTPEAAPSALSQCVIFNDGSYAVVGAEGFVGVYIEE